MIAEIYPIKRMPRRFGVFDYEVPDGMELARGMFVRIPFRFGEMVGVVARVKDVGPRGIELKTVSEIVSGVALREAELESLEAIARDTAQSVSAVLHVAIPSLRVRPLQTTDHQPQPALTIPAKEAPAIALTVSQMSQRRSAFIALPDVKRFCALLATYVREHPDEPVMVLFPNVRDAKLASGRLAAFDPIIVTGEETGAERSRAWSAWRGQSAGILVGTRVAALWTHPALGAIFVVRSGHPNHKQSDRNPRIDARAVADILQDRLHARMFFVDVCPRADDLFRFGPQNILGPETRPRTTVVDMTVERPASEHLCIGSTTVSRIAETLESGRRVICVYNLKGVSRRLQCADCGHRFPCPACGGVLAPYEQTVRCHRCGQVEPMPLSCPVCHGKQLSPKGFGNRAIAQALRELFPEASVSTIEKGSDIVGQDTAQIQVVTRHYFENIFNPFDAPDVGLVADLDADLPLYEPTYRAVENAMVNAEEWRGVAHACHADVILQTESPALFRDGLPDLRRLLTDDLKTRESYGQPPYRRRMRIEFKSDEAHEAAHALRTIEDKIRTASPSADIQTNDGIEASIPLTDVPVVLAAFSSLDDRYIIDTDVS